MGSPFYAEIKKFPLLTRPVELFELISTFGGHHVFVAQDSPEDFAFGGNKVRFYEYLIPEILEKKPDFLLTSGSSFSNHVRVTAEVCYRLGIGCRLLIEDDAPADGVHSPNVARAISLGASVEYIGAFAAMLKISEYAKKLSDGGENFYHVPNAGHTPFGACAYAEFLSKALDASDGISFGEIWAPCASGTTVTGLCAGRAVLGTDAVPPVRGVAVGNTVRGAGRGIRKLILESSGTIPGYPSQPELPDIIDCGKNGYGAPDAELLSLRGHIYEKEGLLLDRTYNLNAFYGMMKTLEENPGDGNVLYVCTGGYRQLGL